MRGSLTRRGLLAAALPGVPALAVAFPERPVRIIVSFPPGGSSDSLARAVGREMAAAWGQSVVADNRAGANGTVAAQLIAAAPPDGHTIGLVAIGHAVNPLPASPARDIAGLLRWARESRTPPTYASGGNGSSQHLAGALFAQLAGVRLTQVPYRGGAPALLDVMAGTVDMIVTQPTLAQLQDGQIRALAVTSSARQAWLPAVPTLAESGLPDYQSLAWYGLVAPRGVPPEVLQKIAAETMRAVDQPAVREVIASQAGEPVGSTPEAFAAFIQAERRRYAPIVAATGMEAD